MRSTHGSRFKSVERVAEHIGYQRDPTDRERWKRPETHQFS